MGGDSLGMKNAGFEVIAHSEINPVFQQTHKLNFPDCQLIGTGDLSKTTDEELAHFTKSSVNLIFAGFPCQGFSNAGQKKVNDPRNTPVGVASGAGALFKEFLRATRIIPAELGDNLIISLEKMLRGFFRGKILKVKSILTLLNRRSRVKNHSKEKDKGI